MLKQIITINITDILLIVVLITKNYRSRINTIKKDCNSGALAVRGRVSRVFRQEGSIKRALDRITQTLQHRWKNRGRKKKKKKELSRALHGLHSSLFISSSRAFHQTRSIR